MAAPAADRETWSSGAGGAAWAAGAADWSTAYTEYLKRSAAQAARTLELYQQVTERVARGELAPDATQSRLNEFVRARGGAYGERLAQLNMRFLGDMVRISTAYLHGLGASVRPDAAAPPSAPEFDQSDPSRWYRQLADYSRELGTRAAQSYQSLLNEVAAGRAQPDEVQQAAAGYFQQQAPELLRRLGELYFEILTDLNDLRADSEQEFLSGMLEQAAPDFALTLVAPLGSMAQAAISIANTQDERARIQCIPTDVRRADGVSPAFLPRLSLAPEELELAPGEEGRLVVTLQLDPEAYDPDVLYVGTLFITGHGEPRLEVPLRIMATTRPGAPPGS